MRRAAIARQAKVAGGESTVNIPVLLGNWLYSQLWYSIPLIVSISLVYAATRHEEMGAIVRHAWHTVVWILGFMAVIMGILWTVSWIL
jgi:hypothetical protein